jgi:hypothetical protein
LLTPFFRQDKRHITALEKGRSRREKCFKPRPL